MATRVDPIVLVIDDHIDTARALVRLLHLEGIKAKHVGRGGDALAYLRDIKPRLLILDLMMPDMNGFEVLQAIRGQSEFDDVPILIYSAWNAPENRAKAFELGAQDFVTKGEMAYEVLLELASRHLGNDGSSLAEEKPC